MKTKLIKGIRLYYHPIGDELGTIHLVIPGPEDPDPEDTEDQETVRLILSSERGRDMGVVFTVDMSATAYKELCEDNKIETFEGCILATSGRDIELREIPEYPSPKRLEKVDSSGNIKFLRSPQLWKHPWGRCNCVKHGDSLEPVTPERILDGEVPWWNSPYTPFQLDLIAASNNTETPNSLHLLCQDDKVCGVCGNYVWVVHDEDVPDELPVPEEEEECPEPLCPERDALSDIEWSSKSDAWQTFISDPHNKSIIESTDLPVERASQQRKYSNEKAFKQVNRQTSRNLYTVKQVFYEALGNTRSGTWADFDLDMMRLVKGLKEVDIPSEILEMVDLDDQEANETLHRAAGHRAARSEIDEEASVLENMLDEEAGFDPEEESEVRAPYKNKPKIIPRTDSKPGKTKVSMLTAARALRAALDQFIVAMEESKASGTKGR